METQLLKLDPPYNIICGRNKVGKHVATLIVSSVDTETNAYMREPYFDIITYSLPVVEYGDGSAVGDVWRDIDVKECRVVAKLPVDRYTTSISGYWFCEILRFLHEGDEYGSTQTPYTLYEQLRALNVCTDKLFRRSEKNEVNVELVFEDYEEVTSVYSTRESQLYFNVAYMTGNEKQKNEKLNQIIRWAGQYLRLLDAKAHFTTKQEQYTKMLDEWNDALDRAAKEQDGK